MNQSTRYPFLGLFSLVLSLLFSTAAFAQAQPVQNGLPSASTSSDGQFVFVPLTDISKKNPNDSATDQKHRPRVILALGGGGMRGAAHVGVLKALVEAGVPIDGIAGTSMGAIVGGLYSAGVPLDELEKRFVNGSMMKSFMVMPLPVRIVIAPILSSPRLIGFHPYDGLYFGGIFHNYLEKALPADRQTIESLRIPYCAVAIDLCDGHAYAIRKGSLASAMQASSAVPELRKPVEINGKLFVDGGVLANVPVGYARQLGADIVIAVQIDEQFHKEPTKDFRKIGSVTKRMINLQLTALDSFHEQGADIIIHPDVDGIKLISTKVSDAKKAIASGEAAAKEALPAIKLKLEQAGLAGLPQSQ